MYCINCGSGDQEKDAYCKRCGKWIGANPPDKRLIVMLVFSLLSAVLGAASAIVLYATYLGSDTGKWSVYLAAAFCLVIAVHQSINFAFGLGLLRRMRQKSATHEVIPSSRNTRALNEASSTDWVDIPRVTENTTELLGSKPRARSTE